MATCDRPPKPGNKMDDQQIIQGKKSHHKNIKSLIPTINEGIYQKWSACSDIRCLKYSSGCVGSRFCEVS